MALIRKASAGGDSFGHVWPKDGAVVEISDGEEIAALMAIPDGGFSEVTPENEPAGPSGDDGRAELSEVDPADEGIDADRPVAKKTAARKTAASKPE
ncbi:hypothetical protein AB0D97_12470 [Streptomyces roseus]|uniref:hypothetical protein n=1 Tax=Streptomyces roseus TaxID=66430 RepID=UPI0033D0107B